MVSDNVVTTSAIDCFDKIIDNNSRLLSKRNYDKDFLKDLCSQLQIQETDNLNTFRDELKNISAQVFINGLLTSLMPLSQMIFDLLDLYSKIDARTTGHGNLKISYKFNEYNHLDLDLTKFAEYKSTIQRVSHYRIEWNQTIACSIQRELAEITHYKNQYFTEDDFKHPCTSQSTILTSNKQLNNCLSKARDLLLIYYQDVNGLKEEFQNNDNDSKRILRIMSTDRWGQQLESTIKSFSNNESASSYTDISDQNIESIINSIDRLYHSQMIDISVKEIQDVLNLPIFAQQRYELYSSWIFTVIINTYDIKEWQFNIRDGRLSFDFGGVLLATLNSSQGPLQLWAEMRTPFMDNYESNVRSNSIQPDYRIVNIDLNGKTTSRELTEENQIAARDATILAIEVKQYWRRALRNPHEALEDYTSNLPNANVVVTEYKEASVNVMNHLSHPERAKVINNIRPGQSKQMAELQKYIKTSVPELITGTDSVPTVDLTIPTNNACVFLYSDKIDTCIDVDICKQDRSNATSGLIHITKTVVAGLHFYTALDIQGNESYCFSVTNNSDAQIHIGYKYCEGKNINTENNNMITIPQELANAFLLRITMNESA